MHNIEHAVRQPGFATNLAQQIRRHRRQLAGLGDGGVADRDGGRDFPAQQIERQVPRRNQSRDAARLAQGVVERDAIGDVRFGFGVQDRGREEAEIARGARNVEAARERERLARVDRLRARELLEIALDQVGDAQKNARPLRRRRARPIRERFLRRGDGQIDIATVAVGDLRIRFAGRRFDVVEIFPADRLNKLAVDEVLNLESVQQARDRNLSKRTFNAPRYFASPRRTGGPTFNSESVFRPASQPGREKNVAKCSSLRVTASPTNEICQARSQKTIKNTRCKLRFLRNLQCTRTPSAPESVPDYTTPLQPLKPRSERKPLSSARDFSRQKHPFTAERIQKHSRGPGGASLP